MVSRCSRLAAIYSLTILLGAMLLDPPLYSVLLGITVAASGRSDLLLTSFFTDNILRFNGVCGQFMGVFASGGGLDGPNGLVFGPDGNLYVTSYNTNSVLRYNGITGEFIDVFVRIDSGEFFAQDLVFGPDRHLYVVMGCPAVLRYDGETGKFIDVFASQGLVNPDGLVFGPDGNLYVGDFQDDNVKCYNGVTGDFMDIFASGGGLDGPLGLVFGPDGNFYVSSAFSDQVLRYDGVTGHFMGVFASGGGIDNPVDLVFRPDGRLYVNGFWSNNVLRYDGQTGEFIDVFVPQGYGGLNGSAYVAFTPPLHGVGGFTVPIDKPGLLAPYIGLTSTIIVATAATAIYVKRVKRRKEKQ